MIAFADIDELYAKDAQLKPEDVAAVATWHRQQRHLPPPLHAIETALFLHSCRYSIDATKKCIDKFYTLRTKSPEYFAGRDPFGPEVAPTMDTTLSILLPNLTPEGFLVWYIRIRHNDAATFKFAEVMKLWDMTLDLVQKQRGFHVGHVGILDMENVTMGHLTKTSLSNVRTTVEYVLHAVPVRLESYHFVNAAPIMDLVVKMVWPFMDKDRQSRTHVHTGDNATIFPYVPRDILPIECGGTKFCATDYFENVTRKDLNKHAEYFKFDERRLVDETMRSGTSKKHELGAQGTFKQLLID